MRFSPTLLRILMNSAGDRQPGGGEHQVVDVLLGWLCVAAEVTVTDAWRRWSFRTRVSASQTPRPAGLPFPAMGTAEDPQASRTAALHLDLRGAGCATTLIELASLARRTAVRTPVLVETDDRGAPEELPAWCRLTGHEFRGPADSENAQCFLLILHPKGTS